MANAKINIGLEVLRKRSDGYHDINTIFAPVNLHDEILVEKSKEIEVICKPNLGISMNDNLAYKAAMAMKIFYSVSEGAKINITKNISAGGGLGGGSSDAATTLKLLARLWEIPENQKELSEIASKIGSDVPFFLRNGYALGRGRGEILDYFDFSLPYYILIVMPGINVSTKSAYQSFKLENNSRNPSDLKSILFESKYDSKVLKDKIVNDFEAHVFLKHPVLKQIKSSLYENGAVFASLSGSGSALFGFYHNREQIEYAKNFLSEYNTYVSLP